MGIELPNDRIEVSRLYYERKYGGAPPNTSIDLSFAAILRDLGITSIRHLTSSVHDYKGLSGFGIEIVSNEKFDV